MGHNGWKNWETWATPISQKEALFDASTTIYNEIARLRRGLNIAQGKQPGLAGKKRVRDEYMSKINKLSTQYKAIMAALSAAGWMMIETWGIWLIASAAIVAGVISWKGWKR